VYGAINEYESNRYVTTMFTLLDQALRNGYYNDFINLLGFFPSLRYIVAYNDLVNENATSFLKQTSQFKLVYQNSVAFVLERVKPNETKNKVWINESPLTVNMTDFNNLNLLATLFHETGSRVSPLFIFNEDSTKKVGVNVFSSEKPEEPHFWAFESESVVKSAYQAASSQAFAYTNLSSSNGRSVILLNGKTIEFNFELPQTGQMNVSIRIMSYKVNNTAFSGENVLAFSMDGRPIGSYKFVKEDLNWKWVNFTVTVLSQSHSLQVAFLGNPCLRNLIDIIVVSKGQNWDELLSSSLSKTFEAQTNTTAGYDMISAIPSNVSSSFLLVIDEAYFPSWRLVETDNNYSPLLANGFLNGFLVKNPSSTQAQIKFVPLQSETTGIFISLFTFVVITTLFPLHKLRKKLLQRGKKDKTGR
jgi:hypothetical protein